MDTHSTDTPHHTKHILLSNRDTGPLYSKWHEACTGILRQQIVSCMMRTRSPDKDLATAHDVRPNMVSLSLHSSLSAHMSLSSSSQLALCSLVSVSLFTARSLVTCLCLFSHVSLFSSLFLLILISLPDSSHVSLFSLSLKKKKVKMQICSFRNFHADQMSLD